jgi:hypothetical protein
MRYLFKEHFVAGSRAEYSLEKFRPYFGKSVLDVGAGGSANYFRSQLGEAYKAADLSDSRNKPDFFIDFESGKLPFKDGQFETVLSFDNLEHCENCHELFDELVRVSSKYVIVALPNNWPSILKSIFWGRNMTHRTGYGLSKDKPGPGVRHKWFFNLEEAEDFITGRAKRLGGKIVETKYVFEGGNHVIALPLLYPLLFRLHKNHLLRFYNLSEQDKAKFGKKGIFIHKTLKTLGLPLANVVLNIVKIASLPFWLLDEVIKQTVWGWGSKFRYLNLFCRQIWVVIEKS